MRDAHSQARQALSALIPYYHTLFDDSLDNICVRDLYGDLIYLNPTLSKTLGIPQNLEGYQAIKATIEPPYHPYFIALEKVVNTGQATDLLLSGPDVASSRGMNDLIYISPIHNADKQVIGTLSIGRELSYVQQLIAKEEKQHNTYLRALLDTFPFMVWMKDKQGRFLEVNQQLAEVVNQADYKALLGKTDFDFFPKEIAQGYVDDDNFVLSTSKPKNVEEEIQKADGSTYLAETYKSPVMVDNQVIGTVGFSRDISERKDFEAEIFKYAQEKQALIESLPMIIVRYDLECKRVYVSSYFDKKYPNEQHHEVSKTPEEQWSPRIINMTGAEYTAYVKQAILTRTEQSFEIVWDHDGKPTMLAARVVPEYNRNNEVIGALAVMQDVTEIKIYRDNIERLAFEDNLTHLPNRTRFNEVLQQHIEAANAKGSDLSVLMIDLDHFKAINDTLGHTIGDQLLAEAAQRIYQTTHINDMVARLGGDEFAIVVSNISNRNSLARLAKNIIQTLSAPFYVEGKELYVSASIGIASYPEHTETPKDLLKFADVAMYMAKKNGRNNYQFFNHEINLNNEHRLNLQTALRHAIEKNELFAEFQPIFDLSTMTIMGYESLMRWHHPTLGRVNPADFINVAEEYGLIIEIGQWMIHQVCKQAVRINESRTTPLMFTINLSARQFVRHNIVHTLQHAFNLYQCDPTWIKVEITESLLLSNNQETQDALSGIHKLGVMIMIDDFGTGFSSLAYLNKFPIDVVKIDQSFIRDITNDDNDAKLVKAIIEMCKSLAKEVTAEGVETVAQLDLLRAWGCVFGQGYLLGKPQALPI